ncbi:NusG domain II-containing protein [bacterium]|nr:NusG domain II-containing protein [bacterium]
MKNPVLRNFRSGDFVIVGTISLMTLIIWAWGMHVGRGHTAHVFSDGREVVVIRLDQDRQIHVPGPLGESVLEVSNGTVRFLSSPCPHQICVRMGAISRSSGSIVCVPNRILVRIPGNSSDKLDGITQ